jgi:type IV secretion system protein VirB10
MAIEPSIDPDGVPAIPGRPPLTGRQRAWVIVVVLAIAVIAVSLTGLITPHKRPATTPEHTISAGMPYTPPAEPKPIEPPRPMPATFSAPKPFTPVKQTAPVKDAALDAPIFSTAGIANDPSGAGVRGLGGSPAGKEKDDEFTQAMTASSVGAPVKAHRMKHPSLTIPAGVIISCVLQTAINSELMGFVDCQLPSEVRGADGTVTLLDKGTTIFGQVKGGLRRGQNRLFILWTRARTPDNVTVDLASPAADELGRAGLGCNNGDDCVNTHFGQMLLHSLLFSLIEYGPQLAATALQSQSHSNVANYTEFLTPQQSLAQTILQDDLRIPPTLEKNQGDVVSIFVARDLDFSGVYALSLTR